MSRLTAKRLLKHVLMLGLLILSFFTPLRILSQTTAEKETIPAAETTQINTAEPLSLSQEEIQKIETFVQRQMAIWKIPGIAVVIVKEDQTLYQKGFGFANLEKKEPVTLDTLFELGSTSKAFTGLAILQLEERSLLKLDDPVEKYLPWLKLRYQGKEVPVMIGHFLYQASGLPHFETLSAIPPAQGDDALEKAVQTLQDRELDVVPGQQFTYTSIGYDVLGLIIQKVSGLSYEEYMKKNIFIPLQMNNTYLFREEARAKSMATGHKICFNRPSDYNAPVYRGNAPAGYVIINARDLALWLKIQVGIHDPVGIPNALIEKSHKPAPEFGTPDYAAGWMIFPNSKIISHGGLNPNFSSLLAFGEEKVGVGVLANMGTDATSGIGQGILSILRGVEPEPSRFDMNVHFDRLSTKILLVFNFFILFFLVLLIRSIIKIIKGQKRFSIKGAGRIIGFIIATVLVAAYIYMIAIIPSLLGFNVSLAFGMVWMPCSFSLALLAIFLTGFLFYLFILSVILFPKSLK